MPSASQCQAPDVHAPQHRIEDPERRDTPFGELLVVPRRLTDRRHSEVPIVMDLPVRLGLLSQERHRLLSDQLEERPHLSIQEVEVLQ